MPCLLLGQDSNQLKLTGTVYDLFGAVVPGALVKAIDSSGKVLEAKTNADGLYVLSLRPNDYDPKVSADLKAARYDIVVTVPGFRESLTKAFAFVPSYKGSMYLDIALETLGTDPCPCGPAGACPFGNETEVPFKEEVVLDKVVAQPTTDLPKATRIEKRRKP